jgi:hypothetical protein
MHGDVCSFVGLYLYLKCKTAGLRLRSITLLALM